MTLDVRTDRQLIRAQGSSTRYLLITYIAPEVRRARTERLPVNVALVLDRSGSMQGDRKFVLAREAVEQALRLLREDDRFALVVYDERVDVLTSSTLATPEAKRRALQTLRDIGPRGSTNLCAGWMRGCEQVAEHLADESICRALLLTDGLANQGTVNRDTLARHAAELRLRGVATSTFGVGADFDERLLRDMAHEGGGNFYFVESGTQIPDVLTSELGEALEVVARDAALTVRLPYGASAEPLNRFRHSPEPRHGANGIRIHLGDLVSTQEVRAVVRVQLPHGEIGERAHVEVGVVGAGADTLESRRELTWTYASHEENDRQPRDREVDREVAALYATRARAEATEANRHRDLHAARLVLERAADRILTYAGDDPHLIEIAAALRNQIPRFSDELMDRRAIKMAFYAAEAESRYRSPEGKAFRRKPSEP